MPSAATACLDLTSPGPLPSELVALRSRLAELARAVYGDDWREISLVVDFGPRRSADVLTVGNPANPR